MAIKKNKEYVAENFPKKLTRVDLEKFQLEYERMIDDDEYLEEIEKIIDFAMPKLEGYLKEGKGLYDFVENKIEISPVGIVPLNTEFGYMLMKADHDPETKVFEYEITIFENVDEKYRGIKTKFITSYIKNISTTFENMKIDLIRNNQSIPNPATFLVLSKLSFPMTETLLPVAKRSFVRYIANNTW